MLMFEHVHFYYKKSEPILQDVTFTVGTGEFVAIVGPNGCGKSTIAKLMDGLLLPKQGNVRVFENNTNDAKQLDCIRQQVGFVFQNPEDQFITTTVQDEVLFGLENIRVPREEMEERVYQALQAVDMMQYIDAMPHELSGGQKQRVAIAAILAMQPKVIIFDEATSMLDPLSRKQLLLHMHSLHKQGMTIVHITHHMEEVLHADRVLLLAEGKLIFDGNPLTFFTTINVADYRLKEPFAVRLYRATGQQWQLSPHWEKDVRSIWSMN